MQQDGYNASVSAITMVTPDIMMLSVETDMPHPGFEAGQYVLLGLPGSAPRSPSSLPELHAPAPAELIQRPYAIASNAREGPRLEFYISHVKSGQLSPRLFALSPGGRLHVGREIHGSFRLNETPDGSDIVMVATGTGIAPYVSFLRTHIAERPESKMVVIAGAAHEEDLGYSGELRILEKTYPNFFYVPTLTDGDDGWAGRRGSIERLLEDEFLQNEYNITPDPEWTHFFVAGKPEMVRNVSRWLDGYGYRRHRPGGEGEYYIEEY